MADINFPSSPSVGDIYTYNNKTWTWNGTSWAGSGGTSTSLYSSLNYYTDTFTGNGSNTQFSLSVSSTTNNSIVFVSGIGQLPTSAYSISGQVITFTEAVANNTTVEVRTPSTYNVYSAPTSYSRYYYTGTNGQTVISGSDNNAATLSYTPNAIEVFVNGILLVPTTDYTATNGTSITLVSALYAGDDVQIVTQASTVFVPPSISVASVPSVTIGSVAFETVGQISTTSTATVSLDTLDMSLYRSAKYMVQVTDTTNNLYHFCELMVLHNGLSAYITEYATLYSSYSLMSFDANVSGSSLFVTGTPTNPNNTVKIYRVAVGV
jgi:hypothetical protein